MKTVTKHYIDGAFVESHGREAIEQHRRVIAVAKRPFASFASATKDGFVGKTTPTTVPHKLTNELIHFSHTGEIQKTAQRTGCTFRGPYLLTPYHFGEANIGEQG